MSYKCTAEQFLETVKDHRLKIVHDDKETFIRHLRFRGKSFTDWYDIITWPGSLCINGDYGTYVFSRVEDMFTFFRSKNGKLEINPGYWSEKIKSESLFGDGVKKFSVKLFEENVKEYFDSFFENSENTERKEFAWDDIEDQLNNLEDKYECVAAMRYFHSDHIDFHDFWECSCDEYTFYFIWCLYAIVYGIKLYDEV